MTSQDFDELHKSALAIEGLQYHERATIEALVLQHQQDRVEIERLKDEIKILYASDLYKQKATIAKLTSALEEIVEYWKEHDYQDEDVIAIKDIAKAALKSEGM
jgi:hypothetical protein